MFDTECQVVRTQMWHQYDDQELIEDIDPFFIGKCCLKQFRTKIIGPINKDKINSLEPALFTYSILCHHFT